MTPDQIKQWDKYKADKKWANEQQLRLYAEHFTYVCEGDRPTTDQVVEHYHAKKPVKVKSDISTRHGNRIPKNISDVESV